MLHSNRSTGDRLAEVAEDARAGSNLTVLKCSILHAQSSPLLTSAAFLSESTPRLIRTGIKLTVGSVSEPRITPKVPGKPRLYGSYQVP